MKETKKETKKQIKVESKSNYFDVKQQYLREKKYTATITLLICVLYFTIFLQNCGRSQRNRIFIYIYKHIKCLCKCCLFFFISMVKGVNFTYFLCLIDRWIGPILHSRRLCASCQMCVRCVEVILTSLPHHFTLDWLKCHDHVDRYYFVKSYFY